MAYFGESEEEIDAEEEETGLRGELKTYASWDPSNRAIIVTARQSLVNSSGIECKYKAQLNSVSGEYLYRGHVRKSYSTNAESSLEKVLQASANKKKKLGIDPDKWLPAGWKPLFFQDWTISPGVTVDSTKSTPIRYSVAIAKLPQILKHYEKLEAWLSGKALLSYVPQSNQVASTANLRVKALRLNLTSKQDLYVSAGMDFKKEPGCLLSSEWYLKLSENNVAVKWQGGRWVFTYKL